MSLTFSFQDVKFYEPEFDRFKNEPSGEIGTAMRKRGELILAFGKAKVGKDTGELAAALHVMHKRIGQYQEVWIGSGQIWESAGRPIHHNGARPHGIDAKPGKMLRFTSKGRVVYTHHVNHPGNKPNRYLSDGLILAYT